MKRALALILCSSLALILCACMSVAAQETLTETSSEPVKEVSAPATEAETSQPSEEKEPFSLFKSIFLPLAEGEVGATFDDFTAAMSAHHSTWQENSGIYYAEEPQHPGNYIALACDGDKISQLIYRSTQEGAERMARVSFTEEHPRYFIKATALHDGVEVLSPKELKKYITGQGAFSEETPQGISNGKMIDILSDNGVFYSLDLYNEENGFASTASEYGAMLSGEIGIPAAITKVAAADLDGDGIKELLLGLTVNGSTDYGTLVLRDFGKNVVGHLFSYRQLYNVKIDGTFWRSGSDFDGASRLEYVSGGWAYVDVSEADYESQEYLRWISYPQEDYSELFE